MSQNSVPNYVQRMEETLPAPGEPEEQIVMPILEDTLEVHKRRVVTGGVRVRKVVLEHEETADLPLMEESVHVARVDVNQYVTEVTAPRTEGDTLIIPVFEEVMVIEKRLLLKEEWHITRTQTETHHPQTVVLRREEATVERIGPTEGECATREG